MLEESAGATRLCLLTLTLSNLGGETGLDGGNRTAGSAGVTSDERQAVLSLVELGIWRSAGLASDILHYGIVSIHSALIQEYGGNY